MTSCTFAEFFDACKENLTNSQLRNLTGKAQYFKLSETGYCGLLIEPERVWVSIISGGMRDIWKLRKALVIQNVPLVGWKCRPDSPMHKIAKYYGAEIKDSGDTYPDGMIAMLCVIQTKQAKRVNKAGAQSQALV